MAFDMPSPALTGEDLQRHLDGNAGFEQVSLLE